MIDEIAQLITLLNRVQLIEGDKDTIGDMVTRYQNPPFTRAYPICIRLSRAEYAKLSQLMQKLNKMVETEIRASEMWIAEQKQRMEERQSVNAS